MTVLYLSIGVRLKRWECDGRSTAALGKEGGIKKRRPQLMEAHEQTYARTNDHFHTGKAVSNSEFKTWKFGKSSAGV